MSRMSAAVLCRRRWRARSLLTWRERATRSSTARSLWRSLPTLVRWLSRLALFLWQGKMKMGNSSSFRSGALWRVVLVLQWSEGWILCISLARHVAWMTGRIVDMVVRQGYHMGKLAKGGFLFCAGIELLAQTHNQVCLYGCNVRCMHMQAATSSATRRTSERRPSCWAVQIEREGESERGIRCVSGCACLSVDCQSLRRWRRSDVPYSVMSQSFGVVCARHHGNQGHMTTSSGGGLAC